MNDPMLPTELVAKTLRDLESELVHLKDRHEAVAAEIRGLRLILASRGKKPIVPENFAEAVRDTLKLFSRPAKAREISDTLWEQGMQCSEIRGRHMGTVAGELLRASRRENSPVLRLEHGLYEYRRD